jgi:hypothetical protein
VRQLSLEFRGGIYLSTYTVHVCPNCADVPSGAIERAIDAGRVKISPDPRLLVTHSSAGNG